MKFQVGDRVKVISREGDASRVYGMTGTVVRAGDLTLAVKFDEYMDGHDCDGNCERGYGWNVRKDHCESVKGTEGEAQFYNYLNTYSADSLKKLYALLTDKSFPYKEGNINGIMYTVSNLSDWEEKIRDAFKRLSFRDEYRDNFIREGKLFLESTNKNNKKEVSSMKTNNILNQFMPSFASSEDFALTMSGKLAVKRENGDYVTFNPESSQIENQMDFVIGGKELSKMVLLMPTTAANLKAGDMIEMSGEYHYVSKIDGKIGSINLTTGETAKSIGETNILIGAKMYKKVVSLLDSFANGNAMTGGMNHMMLMLMADKDGGKDTDMMKMLMLSSMMGGNTETGGMNPMMFLMLGDNGGDSDMMKMLMLSSMMNGSSPFANMFGANSTPSASVVSE